MNAANKAIVALFVSVVVTSAACTAPGRPGTADVDRSPDVNLDVVAKHATQFDDELPERRAGSQEEFAAATYIYGHLQLAGYVVRLDSVPVGNLVDTSNVVALPPSKDDPAIVVTVPYDSDAKTSYGDVIGLFLEVARAFKIRQPHHRVEFVALAAQVTGRSTTGLQVLEDSLAEAEVAPDLFRLDALPTGEPIVYGPDGLRLRGPLEELAEHVMAYLEEHGS